MKSLNIINKQIKADKRQLEFYLDNGIDKSMLTSIYKAIEELEQIKADLEILEILRNHLYFYSSGNPDSEWCDLIGLSNICVGKIEFNKVKKWRMMGGVIE